MVYHDDVLYYELYKDGVELDCFDSNPDYFGHNPEAWPHKGNARLFEPLIGAKTAELEKLLDRKAREFVAYEEVRLEEIAAVLGIRNAVSSFEYLQMGETDFIEGWNLFTELPCP